MFSVPSQRKKERGKKRGGVNWSTHQAHDLKIAGSNPVPA